MSFITKLDFSSNRQVKQYEKLFTALSGGTKFGMPYSALTTGPDLTTTGVTQTYTNLVSTFSGNSGTTIFTWYDPSMALGEPYLSAITPSTSATTQEVGPIFTGDITGTTQDGYVYNATYSGITFDLVGLAMIDLGGGAYSGSVHTNTLTYYSANTIDFTGRTIWVDVSGITRTEDLIITRAPQVGYVWTCVDSEGKGEWTPTGAGSGYWSATTSGPSTNGIVIINSDSIASGALSVAEGFQTTASGDYSHAEGRQTTASGNYSHTEGRQTTASGNYSHAEGYQTTASGSESSHAEGRQTTASGNISHAQNYNTIASGNYSHAGGNFSIASGTTSFVHGENSVAGGSGTIVLGNNITGTSSNYTYVESLNIKTVGAGPSTIDIGVDANGNVVNNASDITLKENIETIVSALDKVKQLRGVSFNWKDKNSGGDKTKIGFIAQEVEEIVPELVYTYENGIKVVYYKDVCALLVEAIKELTSGSTISSNIYLETQSIVAEDNNIDLNFGGNQQTAVEGGIRVLHAFGQDLPAELLTDAYGNWITNNDFKPKAITIPTYTPSGSTDTNGSIGNLTIDEDYLYVKTSSGWKRSNLQSF